MDLNTVGPELQGIVSEHEGAEGQRYDQLMLLDTHPIAPVQDYEVD